MNPGRTTDPVRSTVIVLLVSWLLSACSAHSIPANRAGCGSCEEVGRFVRLQSVTGTGRAEVTPPFAHPFRLSPEEWKLILESIQVHRRGQGPLSFLAANKPAQQAFTPQEIQFFCDMLTRAFAEAQPSELVVFGLTNVRTPEITDVTTGAWYVKGTTLSLIVTNYREGVTMPNIRELVRQQPLHMIAAPLYDFAPGPHQAVGSSDSSLLSVLMPEPLHLTLTYQLVAAGRPAMDESQDAGMPSLSHPPDRSLEEKLRRLKQLYSEGLITDEEYAAKKQSLLDGL